MNVLPTSYFQLFSSEGRITGALSIQNGCCKNRILRTLAHAVPPYCGGLDPHICQNLTLRPSQKIGFHFDDFGDITSLRGQRGYKLNFGIRKFKIKKYPTRSQFVNDWKYKFAIILLSFCGRFWRSQEHKTLKIPLCSLNEVNN